MICRHPIQIVNNAKPIKFQREEPFAGRNLRTIGQGSFLAIAPKIVLVLVGFFGGWSNQSKPSLPPGANTTDPNDPFCIDLGGLDFNTTPPTRNPANRKYPPAIAQLKAEGLKSRSVSFSYRTHCIRIPKLQHYPQETDSSQTPFRLPMSPMPEYRGLFDEAISQRNR
jgi:hypothetical protein